MRCQEHDRDHCPEPRCHVLALCAARIFESSNRTMGAYEIPDGIDHRVVAIQVWLHHLLDALSPHHERVRALANDAETNWDTVLVFLDWLTAQGWSWNEVHEWRPTPAYHETLDAARDRIAAATGIRPDLVEMCAYPNNKV